MKFPSLSPAIRSGSFSPAFDGLDRFELDNGLRIILHRDDRSPLVSAHLFVGVGSIHEEAHLGAGLSHYLEHMLFKGTEEFSADEITRSAHERGAVQNAYTSYNETCYYLEAPATELGWALRLLSQMAFFSTFPEDDWQREKEVILREIAMYQDDPDSVLWEQLLERAFLQSPLRYPIIGYRTLFAQNDRDRLMQFYRRHYVPNNMILVIVGSVSRAEVEKVLRKTFATVERGRPGADQPAAEPLQMGPREATKGGDYQVARSALGYRNFCLTDPRTLKLGFLSQLLAGGRSSRLYRILHEEENLVDDISAYNWSPFQGALFTVGWDTEPSKAEAASARVRDILQALPEQPFSSEELTKVCRRFEVSFWNKFNSLSGMARILGSCERYGIPFDRDLIYLEKIKKITSAEIQELAKEVMDEQHLTQASLLPDAYLRKKRRRARQSRQADAGFQSIQVDPSTRIFWLRDPTIPKVHARLLLPGHLDRGPAAEQGMAALTSRLLRRDTRAQSAAELDDLIDSHGLAFSSSAARNGFTLALSFMREDHETARTILEQAVLQPAFSEKSFQRCCEDQLGEIRRDQDDPDTRALQSSLKRVFPRHPLGMPFQGEPDQLARFTTAKLKRYWEKQLKSSQRVLILCGDLDPEQDIAAWTDCLRKFPVVEGGAATPKKWEIKTGQARESSPIEQSVVMVHYPTQSLYEGDTHAELPLLGNLLNSMGSNLFREVREKRGLAYYVHSGSFGTVGGASFYLTAGCEASQVELVWSEMEKEIDRLQNGEITDSEWEGAKVAVRNQIYQQALSCDKRVNYLARRLLNGFSAADADVLDKALETITREDWQQWFRRVVDPTQRFRYSLDPAK